MLLFTLYLFARLQHRISCLSVLAVSFSYFYIVSAWGGYMFIINLLPLHALVLLVTWGYSLHRFALNTLIEPFSFDLTCLIINFFMVIVGLLQAADQGR
jgi:dolichyl-diphosphooligosaccharide--protein glycosyltransferase